MKLNRKNLLLAASATITIAFTAPFASALPYNWIGADATPWNTAANWSGVVVPTIADDLTILGPLNVAGALTINFDADNSARSLILTNTAATSITNASGADKTLTLGSGGITTGTGAVQIGANVANQAVNITQGAAQTWNIGAGGLTVTNVVSGAATGFTKTGAGNLTFNGSTVQGFTGGLNANGGTVTLNYTNLTIPTDLVAATNALQMSSGALTITGQDVAAATTAQTFAGTTLTAGLNTVNIAKGALATSATLNLGAFTVNSGSSAIFVPTTASVWTTTASTTEKVFITAGGSVPAFPGAGTTAFVGGSVFHRVGTQLAGSLRLAAVDEFGQLLNKANAGNLAVGTGVDPTGSYQLAAGSLALTGPATSVYGLLLNANTNPVTITVPDSGTLTLNSVIQIKASEGVTIAAGTGVSNVVIGAEKNLVIAMDNNAGFGISAPIVDNGGGASAVTVVGGLGTGGATLSGNNAYTGVTTVDGTATTASRSLLTVAHNNALGTTDAGTVLIGGPASGDGARILLGSGITVTGETLTIRTGGTGNRSSLTQAANVTSAWNGNIVVDANTGFGQIFASGATSGVMTIGASATDTMTLNGTTTLRGTGSGTINSTISGVGGLGKTDAGTWTLTAANNYSGTTNVGNLGTLRIGAGGTTGTLGTGNVTLTVSTGSTLQFNRTDTYTLAAGNIVTGIGAVTLANTGSVATAVDGQFNTTGSLNFGSSAASTTVSTLDLTNGSSTFASLLVQNNSASDNAITIGSGKTLTITGGSIQIGATTPPVAGAVTKLAMTGGGEFIHNGSTFLVGGAGNGQLSTLDLTGLPKATFTTTGNFRIAPNTGTNNGGQATLLLPTPAVADTVATATINVGAGATRGLSIGNGGSLTSSFVNTLQLGTGLTTINTPFINVSSNPISGNLRDVGQLIYGQANIGDLKIRGVDGSSRAGEINLGVNNTLATQTTGTAGAPVLFDVSGHDADIFVTSLNFGGGLNRTSNQTHTFKFGAQTTGVGVGSLASNLDVTNVNIGNRSAGNSSTLTQTFNVEISGGTVLFGNVGATGTGVSIGNSAYDQAGAATFTSSLNISGGTTTIHNGTGGFAVRLGQSTAANSGIVNATMNLTGGTTTLTGDIVRGTATGTVNSTLKISGGTLDMDGHDIGTLSAAITLTAESGTLSNVASINGTGGLTKTTVGTLTVSGTNTYAGVTTISDGTLALGANNALPATPVSIGTATLNASTFDDNLGTLDVTGSAVINLDAGANLVFANSSGLTWTGPNLNITGTFVSGSSLNFGIGGLSGAQLALISVNGAGTGTYTLNGAGFLIAPAAGSNYASWAIANGIPGEPASGDFDNDGISNLVEYALGKSPTVSSQPAGVLAGNVITYTKGADAIANGDVSWVIETSQTLVGAWLPQVTQAPSDPALTISYTLTPSTPTKNFARLKVTQIP